MNIRTILVPVDFSTCSLLVTRQAAGLAARLGARVVVMHVSELPGDLAQGAHVRPDGVDRTAAEYLTADARERLALFVSAAREVGAAAEIEVRIGPVVPTILAAADALAADLIVIGTHGRTGLARMVLGSVAEGVAHKAHVPVMLVRRESRPECARQSCEWCPHEGRSPAEEKLAGESQG
ncbi:MAG: universal stress protein [Pseudomonadota bacterium]|nr:universal stress protein [Pseudomonadota bacterium]